jgi:DNA invertase Pin-like site-specific DNA recombinase
MIYGYIRVSTDKQTVENQRYELNQFCERNAFIVDKWIEETTSILKDLQERKLGKLLKKMKRGDVLICSVSIR